MTDNTPYPQHGDTQIREHTNILHHNMLSGGWASFYPTIAVPTVKFMKLHDEAVIPTRGTNGAACFDLTALFGLDLVPWKTSVIKTGIGIMLPAGHVGLVCSRSGLAVKGVSVQNAPGVIDEDYTGEIKVILHNSAPFNYMVNAGDRIAQLMVVPLPKVNAEVVDYLPNIGRGANGLGSTGV